MALQPLCGQGSEPGAWASACCAGARVRHSLLMAALLALPQTCAMCSLSGGAFKRTTKGAWVHCVCALWCEDCGFGDLSTLEPVHGEAALLWLRRVHCRMLIATACRRSHPARRCGDCVAKCRESGRVQCMQDHGCHDQGTAVLHCSGSRCRAHRSPCAALQCSVPRCKAHFHAICGRRTGKLMVMNIKHELVAFCDDHRAAGMVVQSAANAAARQEAKRGGPTSSESAAAGGAAS